MLSTSAKNSRRISLKSVGLTVLRCTEIFLFFINHLSNLFTPHSAVAFLVFFAWAFCSISSSYSLFKSEFWLEKSWSSMHFIWNKISISTELQSEQAQIRASFEMESSGSHWPIEVVWHLCSQSKSGWQMNLQPAHLPFGPRNGAFYRGQLVIWPPVLIIIRE